MIGVVLVASMTVEKVEQRTSQKKRVGSPTQGMGPMLPEHKECPYDPDRHDKKRPPPIKFHGIALPVSADQAENLNDLAAGSGHVRALETAMASSMYVNGSRLPAT